MTALAATKWDWPLQHGDGMVNVQNDKDKFECDLEMPSFKAKEIDVKVMKDELVVHCSQEGGPDRMPREIHRVYHLPPDVDMSTVKSSLQENGMLRITASKKKT